MAVVSRIMWTAKGAGRSPSDLLLAAKEAIAPWAMEAVNGVLPVTDEAVFERTGRNPGLRTVRVRELDDPCALMVDVEDDDRQGAVWGVRIRLAFADHQVSGWVDNTLESDTVTAPFSLGRPRVVDALLTVGQEPVLGNSRILSEPQDIPADATGVLHEILTSQDRMLPVVVVTCSWNGPDTTTRRRATDLARRLTGLATVVMLGPEGQNTLKRLLPDRLGVWGGAIRVYAPVSLDSPAAHRIYSNDLLQRRGLDPVVNWVTSMSSRRRPPSKLRVLDLPVTHDTITSAEGELEKLRLERDLLQEQLDNEMLEHAETAADLNKALARIDHLRRMAFGSGRGADVAQADREGQETCEAQMTVDEAVDRARAELSQFLAIPDAADQELERLDETPNALSWGSTVWRGLKALADYARDVRDGHNPGGFWNWCDNGGSWPATTKKLAMSESQSVENSTKLRAKRVFPVDRQVEPSGRIYMGAHLKISEGGGNLAPRIYFMDDTAGTTQQIHVGFVGPHYLVPNTKS